MDISGIPYQLRIDINDAPNSVTAFINTHFVKFKNWSKVPIVDYIMSPETSENHKLHFQCIIWFERLLTNVQTSQIRNYIKALPVVAETYQPVSFTKSIRPHSLSSYCCKTGLFITSLTKQQQSQIPAWLSSLELKLKQKQLKDNKKSLFVKQCLAYVTLNPHLHDVNTTTTTIYNTTVVNPFHFINYLQEFSKIYYSIYESAMRRHTGINMLFKAKLLTHEQYCRSLYENFFSL